MPRRFVHIHRSETSIGGWLKAGVGVAAAFGVALWLGDITGASMIVAPMGASAALIFGQPESRAAQPAHVVLGHMLAGLVAMSANAFLPGGPVTLAATLGCVIVLLGVLHLNHAPAAATAVIILLTHPKWMFLLTPLLSGLLTLIAVAVLIHRLPPRKTYPLALPARN